MSYMQQQKKQEKMSKALSIDDFRFLNVQSLVGIICFLALLGLVLIVPKSFGKAALFSEISRSFGNVALFSEVLRSFGNAAPLIFVLISSFVVTFEDDFDFDFLINFSLSIGRTSIAAVASGKR